MKSLMVLAVVGVVVAIVSAHGPGGQGRPQGGPGGRPGGQGGPGGRPEGQGGPGGNRQFGGYRPFNCVCGSQCATNPATTTLNLACRESRNQYLQCVGTTCSNQTCPADQLFNATSGVCEACATGFHVDAPKRRCVCNEGTTLDSKTRACVACPTGSNITADRCDCIYPALVNKVAKACQTCPTGSTRVGKGCACDDRKQFWNADAFACQNCPGSWVNVTKTDRPSRPIRYVEVCQCPISTDVFNKRTVTCVTCPAGSAVATNNDRCKVCKCTGANQEYDDETNTCVDRSTLIKDSSRH